MFSETPQAKIFVPLGPLLAVLLGYSTHALGWQGGASITLAITFLCALWWATEAIPIPITSLLPLALFPLFDVLSPKEVAEAYGNEFILLLLGGFLLSTAMAHTNTHQRIALLMINLFGGNSYRRVIFGFMATSALLSMWISNTATTLMLLPIALAVIGGTDNSKLKVPLLLGICYAASIGGIGTPIGTPPNLIFMKVYKEFTDLEFSFVRWMSWGVPLVLLFTPLAGMWLTRKVEKGGHINLPPEQAWTSAQKRVLAVFAATAFLWVTRNEPFGGWSELTGLHGANDASVVLIAVVALFLISDGEKKRLLDWQTANRIPWGVLLLFSSGLCIAKAFGESGLADILANGLSGLGALPLIVLIAFICLVVTFATELTSNTATTALLMPILASVALGIGVEPYLLMIPAAMSASCAFMLPVATAPNAIIFGSDQVPIRKMIREGLILNLTGACLITLLCYLRVG